TITDDVLLTRDAGAWDRLWDIATLLLWVGGFSAGVLWLRLYLTRYLQNRISVEIRVMLCERIVRLPMAFHAKQRAGDLLSRIQADVTETRKGLDMLFGSVITEPFMIAGLAGVAFYLNWRLALFVFVGMPILLVPISYFAKRIKKYARKRQAKRADVTQAINQMLSGVRVVKAFRMEEHESKHIRGVSMEFLREAMRVARNQVTSRATLEFVQQMSGAVVLVIGGYLVLDGSVTLGDLMAFILIMAKMYRSVKQLSSTYNKMQEAMAGAERIFEVLDTPDTMADAPNARALVKPRREIAFRDVSFRYGPDQPMVLNDIDFTAPVGQTVALVGTTGAGKSTLLDLVARFYDPEEGSIAIDGVDLRQYSRTSLMAQIAIVTQEPFLFNATVAENLRYGKPGASQSEIEAAARAAHMHEEIQRLDDGYETIVGERGGRVSGGQRQRLTIARAILKDPPILILDEATSALDSKVEKKVQDALNNLMKDRTTFVIAHRLSTIQHADLILVLEGGRIVERGTHKSLIEIGGGVYRHLYEIQFGSVLDAEGEGERRTAAG
ncbi:MAG: ABC transporter ATP-binding protein, partial [Planctomycetota bacterium]